MRRTVLDAQLNVTPTPRPRGEPETLGPATELSASEFTCDPYAICKWQRAMLSAILAGKSSMNWQAAFVALVVCAAFGSSQQ